MNQAEEIPPTIQDKLEMKNLHEVLESTMFEARQKEAEEIPVNLNIKVMHHVREKAHLICEAHGVTLSNYLRKCLERLVEEYGG